MIFNTDNKGTFFKFSDDDGGVTVRVCPASVIKKISKATTKKLAKVKQGRLIKDEIVDEDKYDQMLWDYVIVDWKKVCGSDGIELPCTTENKVLMMNESIEFAQFVGKCIELLTEDVEVEYKAQEKN